MTQIAVQEYPGKRLILMKRCRILQNMSICIFIFNIFLENESFSKAGQGSNWAGFVKLLHKSVLTETNIFFSSKASTPQYSSLLVCYGINT